MTNNEPDSGFDSNYEPFLKNHRILVTGATGQVARPIAEKLHQHNEVFAAARFTDSDARRSLEEMGIKTVRYTLGDQDLSHMPEVDYVIHCAVNLSPKSTDIALHDNAEGTGFLMNRYRDVRSFFHMSSSSVYRKSEDPRAIIGEDADLGGYSSHAPHYAMSKLVTEGIVRYQARALQLPTVIARLDIAYGLYGHGGVPTILYNFMTSGIPYQKNRLSESYCCPIYQDDIVGIVERLLCKADVPATVVNLGGDEAVSIEEMIRYIESLTGESMTIETSDMATWQTQICDKTLRMRLAGPCQISWKSGIRHVLSSRFPNSVNRAGG